MHNYEINGKSQWKDIILKKNLFLLSYRLKKDLRNIIKLYGNPGWVVSAEERFRAMMARAQFYKASAAPPLKGIPDLRLKNLKLFYKYS